MNLHSQEKSREEKPREKRLPIEVSAENVEPAETPASHRDVSKETFIGEALVPEEMSFSVSPMTTGRPGLPRTFTWRRKRFSVLAVLEEWKEAGDCHHGSGERYIRKHWFRVRTTENLEMKIYFERQARSSGGSRWRLYSLRNAS